MIRILLLALALALPLLHAPDATALIELRLGYEMLSADPGDLNSVTTIPKTDSLQGLAADVLIDLPLVPVGFGVRYELLMQEESASGNTVESTLTRASLLVNKRLLDNVVYLGAVGTVGFMNDFEYKLNGTTYNADAGFTASAGVEAGIDLLLISLGGEIGYLYAPMGDLKSNATPLLTASGTTAKPDMSGPYMKLMVGIGF